MDGFLLDTNVVSETRKARADRGVMAFLKAANAGSLYLSVLTLGELRKGVAALRRNNPVAADEIALWVDRIASDFEPQLLPIDGATARWWGELPVARTLPVIDALIAATALRHELTLVTRNTRDFESTGVPLLDPWQE